MKEVKATTIPTLKQMSNMAFNLKEKFSGYSTIDIEVGSHAHGVEEIQFKVYIADRTNESFDNWITLQGYYFTLMEPSNDLFIHILHLSGSKISSNVIIYQGIYPVMKLCPSNVVHNSEKTFRLCFLAVDTNP